MYLLYNTRTHICRWLTGRSDSAPCIRPSLSRSRTSMSRWPRARRCMRCVCMYMHICVLCVCVCVWKSLRVWADSHARGNVWVLCTYICVCVYMRVSVCVCAWCLRLCVCAYAGPYEYMQMATREKMNEGCVHLHMCVRIYACVCVWERTSRWPDAMKLMKCGNMCLCKRMNILMCMWVCECECFNMKGLMSMSIHTHMYIYIYIYIYIHICILMCIYFRLNCTLEYTHNYKRHSTPQHTIFMYMYVYIYAYIYEYMYT